MACAVAAVEQYVAGERLVWGKAAWTCMSPMGMIAEIATDTIAGD
jgi:hypothetical protein